MMRAIGQQMAFLFLLLLSPGVSSSAVATDVAHEDIEPLMHVGEPVYKEILSSAELVGGGTATVYKVPLPNGLLHRSDYLRTCKIVGSRPVCEGTHSCPGADDQCVALELEAMNCGLPMRGIAKRLGFPDATWPFFKNICNYDARPGEESGSCSGVLVGRTTGNDLLGVRYALCAVQKDDVKALKKNIQEEKTNIEHLSHTAQTLRTKEEFLKSHDREEAEKIERLSHTAQTLKNKEHSLRSYDTEEEAKIQHLQHIAEKLKKEGQRDKSPNEVRNTGIHKGTSEAQRLAHARDKESQLRGRLHEERALREDWLSWEFSCLLLALFALSFATTALAIELARVRRSVVSSRSMSMPLLSEHVRATSESCDQPATPATECNCGEVVETGESLDERSDGISTRLTSSTEYFCLSSSDRNSDVSVHVAASPACSDTRVSATTKDDGENDGHYYADTNSAYSAASREEDVAQEDMTWIETGASSNSTPDGVECDRGGHADANSTYSCATPVAMSSYSSASKEEGDAQDDDDMSLFSGQIIPAADDVAQDEDAMSLSSGHSSNYVAAEPGWRVVNMK